MQVSSKSITISHIIAIIIHILLALGIAYAEYRQSKNWVYGLAGFLGLMSVLGLIPIVKSEYSCTKS